MNIKRINEYLIRNEGKPKVFEQDYFDLAICEIRLGNYSKAKIYLDQSLALMFEPKTYWRASGQPNWLVDIAVLSGRTDLYPSVLEELNIYRISGSEYSHTGGDSPMAHYCYCVMEILFPGSGNISLWIKDLLKRAKYKDLYAAGLVFQAIVNKDQVSFSQSLELLLKAHAGMAKYGGLRLTPEGWLCRPAMTLSILAFQNSLKVEIQNQYLSLGYLSYLQNVSPKRGYERKQQ